MPIAKRPDTRDQHTRQDAQVTQFGDQRVVENRIQLYTQGRYSPDAVRETTTEDNGASIVNNTTTADLSTGTNADGLARLQTKRRLNYAPENIFEWSRLLREPDGLVDDQHVEAGLFGDGDGVLFDFRADDLFLTIRESFGGNENDRHLRNIDSGATMLNVDDSTSGDLLQEPRIYFIRGSFYGLSKIVWGYRESHNVDVRDPGRTETILGIYDASKDPGLTEPQYTRTINLPSTVEIANGGTTPSAGRTVEAGETQIGVWGQQPKDPQPLFEQFHNLSVAAADGEHTIAGIKLRDNFSGLPTDVNVELVNIDVVVQGGTDDVSIWTERAATENTGDYDDSQYSSSKAPYQIGLGDNYAGGNVVADRTDAVPTRPSLYATVGTQGSAEPQSRTAQQRLTVGRDEVVLVRIEAPNTDATLESLQIDLDVYI